MMMPIPIPLSRSVSMMATNVAQSSTNSMRDTFTINNPALSALYRDPRTHSLGNPSVHGRDRAIHSKQRSPPDL